MVTSEFILYELAITSHGKLHGTRALPAKEKGVKGVYTVSVNGGGRSGILVICGEPSGQFRHKKCMHTAHVRTLSENCECWG